MENKHTIKPFDEATNVRLRNVYLESLGRMVQYGDDPPRPRVRKIGQWQALPPFGRHGWSATKGVFANHTNPKDITQHNVFVWSDLHFGHKNIIRYSERPFNTVEEMNELLILAYNDIVQPQDVTIWVGDIGFYPDSKTNEILHRCNGYKILVVGNHDFNKRELRKLHFDEVHIVYNVTINDTIVAFTHYPLDNVPKGWINIHGHVHKGKADKAATNRHINVNCEFIDYKPISLNNLADTVETLSALPEGQSQIAFDEYDQ